MSLSIGNGHHDYGGATLLIAAMDRCCALGDDGCEGCESRAQCLALWDAWVEQDLAAHVGRLVRRVASLERMPGWRLPPGQVIANLPALEVYPQAKPLEYGPNSPVSLTT